MKPHRSIATVLFTDMVGSTERAAELGDHAWRELLAHHHRVVRDEIRRWGGEEITEAGDGFLVLFDSSARAIACADAIRRRVRGLGIEIRCGLHMGQTERGADGSAGGIAVHVGARVMGEADSGQIVVTSVIRDAETGSGFGFEDLGRRSLKGIDREWRLFCVNSLPANAAALVPGTWERLRRGMRSRGFVGAAVLAVLLAGGYAAYHSVGPGAAMAREIRSIAVLPLDNLSGDPQQDYFAEGMTEAMITELSKLGALRVISRRSVLRYQGTSEPASMIAAELGVDGVIEGSVVRDGDRVRITAQLVHGGSDTEIWAGSFDGTTADVLVLQSEVARRVAREIEIAVSPEVEARLAQAGLVNPETYESYLKGMLHIQRLTPEDTQEGLKYLREATEKNPGDALAWAGLALGYANLGHSPASPPGAWQMARAAAERALKLDPDQAEAHQALADVKTYWYWDWEGAEREFRLANELNPNLSMNHYHYAWYLDLFGRLDEAIAEHKLAQELDPLTPLNTAWLGRLYLEAGRYDEALAEARKAIEMDPHSPIGSVVLGQVLLEQGLIEEAVTVHESLAAASPRSAFTLGLTYVKAGRREDARRILAALESTPPSAYNAYCLAVLNAALGNADEAFRWTAYEPHHAFLAWVRVNPWFEPYHDDPRFIATMKRMGLPLPEPAPVVSTPGNPRNRPTGGS